MKRRAFLAAAGLVCARHARSSQRVKVGLALPLTGVQATVAQELLAGYELAFADARERGVNVDAVVIDDGSQPERTERAMETFARDSSVIAASGIVGTPHAKAAIPAARRGGLPLVGLRSGASELRDGGDLVYHLRASYEAELSRTVRSLADIHRRIAVVASNDAFGKSSARHVLAEAKAAGVTVSSVQMAERNGSDVTIATDKALAVRDGATALLVLMITKPAMQAVTHARRQSFLGAICTMSFTAGAELASMSVEFTRGLGLVTAFPLPRTAHDDTSERFKAAAARGGAARLIESLNAAEGFWYGCAIATALARSPSATRMSLTGSLEQRPSVMLGGERLSFDERRVGRQYLRLVHFDRDGVLRA